MKDEVIRTSDATSEVKPAVKQSAEAKLIAEIMQAWAALQQSDANWSKNGLAFGKKCSEWRKKYSKQGSRKGLGFEPFCAMHGINYRKARYWADHYDKKISPQYEGGGDKGTTTKEKKAAKPKGFVLDLRDDQLDAMVSSVGDEKTFSLFAYKIAVQPTDAEVRWVIERCLKRLSFVQDRLTLLSNIGDWVDDQCYDLEQTMSGHPAAVAPSDTTDAASAATAAVSGA